MKLDKYCEQTCREHLNRLQLSFLHNPTGGTLTCVDQTSRHFKPLLRRSYGQNQELFVHTMLVSLSSCFRATSNSDTISTKDGRYETAFFEDGYYFMVTAGVEKDWKFEVLEIDESQVIWIVVNPGDAFSATGGHCPIIAGHDSDGEPLYAGKAICTDCLDQPGPVDHEHACSVKESSSVAHFPVVVDYYATNGQRRYELRASSQFYVLALRYEWSENKTGEASPRGVERTDPTGPFSWRSPRFIER